MCSCAQARSGLGCYQHIPVCRRQRLESHEKNGFDLRCCAETEVISAINFTTQQLEECERGKNKKTDEPPPIRFHHGTSVLIATLRSIYALRPALHGAQQCVLIDGQSPHSYSNCIRNRIGDRGRNRNAADLTHAFRAKRPR